MFSVIFEQKKENNLLMYSFHRDKQFYEKNSFHLIYMMFIPD